MHTTHVHESLQSLAHHSSAEATPARSGRAIRSGEGRNAGPLPHTLIHAVDVADTIAAGAGADPCAPQTR
jgi:hypothetical protein